MASSDMESLFDGEEEEPEKTVEQPKSYLKDQIVSCMVLIFFIIASTATMPLLSQYIHARYEEVYSNKTNGSSAVQNSSWQTPNASQDNVQVQIQQDTSFEILKLSLCLSLPPAIVNMLIGSYSDHLGRRLPFLLPLFGTMCKFIIISLVVFFHLDLNFLLLAVLLEGCSGGWSAFFLVSLAYAADVTPTCEKRTLALVVLDSSVSVAVACSQLLTGFLIKKFGFFYPCISSIGFLVLSATVIIFGLSETVRERKKQDLSPLVHIKKVFQFYTNKEKNNNRCLYLMCLIVFSLLSIAMNGKYSVETLYQLGLPFCWDSLKIGYWGALYTLIQTISGLLVINLSCVKAEVLAVLSLLMASGSLILEGLATTDAMMYAVPAVACISSIGTPVIRSIMSRMAGPQQQGALFSSLATVDTLCGAVGGAVFTALYSATLVTMRGMVFLILAGIVVLAFFINLITIVKFPSQSYEVLVLSPEQEVVEDYPSVQRIDIVHSGNAVIT